MKQYLIYFEFFPGRFGENGIGDVDLVVKDTTQHDGYYNIAVRNWNTEQERIYKILTGEGKNDQLYPINSGLGSTREIVFDENIMKSYLKSLS